jgi:hypothetical protein
MHSPNIHLAGLVGSLVVLATPWATAQNLPQTPIQNLNEQTVMALV